MFRLKIDVMEELKKRGCKASLNQGKPTSDVQKPVPEQL